MLRCLTIRKFLLLQFKHVLQWPVGQGGQIIPFFSAAMFWVFAMSWLVFSSGRLISEASLGGHF